MTTKGIKLGTHQLVEALAAIYSAPEYAFFREVGDGTGSGQRRWADGLAISLWPSRGLTIDGFEVKASRGDWLKELREPAKAEAVCRYCDRFWLVVGDAAIVKPGELPKTWGLLVPTPDRGLRREVDAPTLTPAPLDRSFVAAIARRAAEQSADGKIAKAAFNQGFEKGREQEQKRSKDGRATEALLQLTKRVRAFEEASGLCLSYESYPEGVRKLGEAARFLLHGEATVAGRANQLATDLQRLVDQLKTVAAECTAQKKKGA